MQNWSCMLPCGHSSIKFFYVHGTLGLRIHFPYLSQPNISKICSFINLCIHPSPIWVSGKIFIAFTRFPTKKTFVLIGEFLFKEKWEVIFFQKHVCFLANQFYFFIYSSSIKLLLFIYFLFLKRLCG